MTSSDFSEIHIRLPLTKVEIVGAVEEDIEAFAPHDYGPAPRWGWDNAVDIVEAKRRCQDMAGGPLANKQGLDIIFDLAMRLRSLGISQRTAVDLIHRYCTSPLSKADVSQQCHTAYKVARSMPGVMSSARYENENANAAIIGIDRKTRGRARLTPMCQPYGRCR